MEATMQTTHDYSMRFPVEAQLIEAARAGDASALIEHLYGRLRAWARRLVLAYPASLLDADDLLQVGAEKMVRSLGAALVKSQNPCAWLMHAAQVQMLRECRENSAIRVPYTALYQGRKAPQVVSLDAPLRGCEDLTLLDVIPAGG
jgi:DNA-directed RNA polymerase specialized sigma24 family protein